MIENILKTMGSEFAMHAYTHEVFEHEPLHVLIPTIVHPTFREDHLEAIKRDHLKNIKHTIEYLIIHGNTFSDTDKTNFAKGYVHGLKEVHEHTKTQLQSGLDDKEELKKSVKYLDKIREKLKNANDAIKYFDSKE